MDYKLVLRRFFYFYFMWFFVHILGKVLFSNGTHAETGEYLYTATPYIVALIGSVVFVVLPHLKDRGKVV